MYLKIVRRDEFESTRHKNDKCLGNRYANYLSRSLSSVAVNQNITSYFMNMYKNPASIKEIKKKKINVCMGTFSLVIIPKTIQDNDYLQGLYIGLHSIYIVFTLDYITFALDLHNIHIGSLIEVMKR